MGSGDLLGNFSRSYGKKTSVSLAFIWLNNHDRFHKSFINGPFSIAMLNNQRATNKTRGRYWEITDNSGDLLQFAKWKITRKC